MNTKPFYIERPLTIHGYDIDFGGIVSNIVYIRWLEDMRSQVLSQYYPLKELVADQIVPVVIETHVKYKRQLKMFDAPVGKMWIAELGKVRWQAVAEIIIDGHVAFESLQDGVFVCAKTGRPARIPANMLKAYTNHT